MKFVDLLQKHAKAFTLAEVLITLAIVGVIAAMTIPALITKIKNKTYETQFKTTYSRIYQAYLMITNDYSSFAGLAKNSDDMVDLFNRYTSGSMVCKAGQSYGICWPKKWYTIKGEHLSATENVAILVLANGASLNFNSISSTCTSSQELNEPVGCARIRVDTNGIKLPNRVGRDIFDFYITDEYGLVPRGADITNSRPDNVSGWGRAAYLLQYGKMDY